MKPKQTNTEKSGVAEVELVYHSKVKAADRPKVDNTGAAYKVLLNCWNKDTIELLEEFKVMLLNNRLSLLGIYELSKGGISATFVDPRLIYAAALKAAATSIILAHNHPSGELRPSRADEDLTRRIVQGCTLLDIKVNDHLIITPDKYFSFANEGLL
ncbi:MAG TPA: JAB domain-containing protein [Puia sp.]|jgi:DNA repair protein RadC|nr:JAB domain-containing protein [Puia sp.]